MTRRTKPIGVLIATAIFVMTAAGVSYAQERDTSEARTDSSAMMGMERMGGMTGMMNMMRAMMQGPDALLRHGKALGLSHEQVARLEALRDSVRAEARAVLTSEQREAFAGMARGMMGAGDSDYELAYQRGVQAVIWGMPAASMLSFRRAQFRDAGADFGDILYMGGLGEPRHEALTANNQTPYAIVLLNVKDEPMVLEIPPASSKVALFGSAIDVWQVPVADIGPAGEDAGRGGRYLFLPPGHDGPVSPGFIPVQMETYGIYVALRPIAIGDGTLEDAIAYAQTIKAYPLAAAGDPPANRYIDLYPLERLGTLPEYNMAFFEDLAQLVNEEVALEQDKVMFGMLASIGIENGVPFEPDEKTRRALEQALVDARAMMEHYFETPGRALEIFWPDRKWGAITLPSESGFVFDEGDKILLDARAGGAFYWATFLPKQLGAGTYYLMSLRDRDGDLLLGSGNYRLRVPADVPTRDFWSIIVYSKDTKAFIYNDLNRPGLSSYDTPNMVGNEDGTFDVYFGPSAPQGLESNWIPTAGEDFFLMFRFYGPEPALYEKEWKLPDVEKMD